MSLKHVLPVLWSLAAAVCLGTAAGMAAKSVLVGILVGGGVWSLCLFADQIVALAAEAINPSGS